MSSYLDLGGHMFAVSAIMHLGTVSRHLGLGIHVGEGVAVTVGIGTGVTSVTILSD